MPNFKNKVCQRCGIEFTPTGANQKVCTDCIYLNDLERSRENSKKAHANGPGSGGNQFGENNHQYRTKRDLPKKTIWVKRLKKEFLELLDGEYFCNCCGEDLREYVGNKGQRGMWVVHHIDFDRDHNEFSNYELLCKQCHLVKHGEERRHNAKV